MRLWCLNVNTAGWFVGLLAAGWLWCGRAAALESERTTDRLPVSCFICRCFSDQFIGFSSSSAKILRFELLKCEMFACLFPPLQWTTWGCVQNKTFVFDHFWPRLSFSCSSSCILWWRMGLCPEQSPVTVGADPDERTDPDVVTWRLFSWHFVTSSGNNSSVLMVKESGMFQFSWLNFPPDWCSDLLWIRDVRCV